MLKVQIKEWQKKVGGEMGEDETALADLARYLDTFTPKTIWLQWGQNPAKREVFLIGFDPSRKTLSFWAYGAYQTAYLSTRRDIEERVATTEERALSARSAKLRNEMRKLKREEETYRKNRYSVSSLFGKNNDMDN